MAKSTSFADRVSSSRWGSVVVLVIIVAIVAAGIWIAMRPKGDSAGSQATQAGASSSVDSTAQAKGPAPDVGKPAPALQGTSPDGSTVTLADHRGRPVWLVFNATWCPACRAEAPDVEAIAQSGTVDVITGYMGESGQTITDFAKRLGLTSIAVEDPDEQLSSNYRVLGIPAHFFIDSEGVIRSTYVGEITKADALRHIKDLDK